MPRAVGRDEVRTLVARGAQLVEVLPGEEFRDEHLPGAINIPIRKIEEARWAWHIGLDAESSAILNELWAGSQVEQGRMQRILALFELTFDDPAAMRGDISGRSVYLAVAATEEGAVRMKPQNLLINLPVHEA